MDMILRFNILKRPMGFGLKGLKYGPLLAVVLLALAACGGSEPASQPDAEGGGPPGGGSPIKSAETALIAVQGNLAFPKREELTFGVTGTVGQILAAPGQKVSEGEALAALDTTTISRLERTYSQQRVLLERAQEDLADFKRELQQSLAQAKQLEAQARHR